MPFQIILNDITRIKADAIVTPAQPGVGRRTGVNMLIHRAAGAGLLGEHDVFDRLSPGEAVATTAYNLRAKYVIHTAVPGWNGGGSCEKNTLRRCYANSLSKAAELGCTSVAFPLLGGGEAGFPKELALKIAVDEINAFLIKTDSEMLVTSVIFSSSDFVMTPELFPLIEKEPAGKGVRLAFESNGGDKSWQNAIDFKAYYRHKQSTLSIVGVIGRPLSELLNAKDYEYSDGDAFTFRKHLLELIDKKIATGEISGDSDAYNKSNISRGAFNKIITGDTKVPNRSTVMAFCIGLRLSPMEAKELLAAGGYAFNPNDKRDMIVLECIGNKYYDMNGINCFLFKCGHKLLGNVLEN